MQNNQIFKTAILETIFHWEKGEGLYSKSIKSLFYDYLNNKNINDERLKFYQQKIFHEFLKNYSIRRNFLKGENKEIQLLKLFLNDFFSKLKNSYRPELLIDNMAKIIKEKNISDKKCISLTSKISFLLLPDKLPLYDNVSKNSLWLWTKRQKIKFKKNILSNYNNYFRYYNNFYFSIKEKLMKETAIIINKNKNVMLKSPYLRDFIKNPKLLAFRSADKILWMQSIERQTNSNKHVMEFIKNIY